MNERAAGHDSAELHVAGRARYVDDLPLLEGTLHAAIGTSTMAHAKIKRLDLSAVKRAPGVISVLTAQDIPGKNNHAPVANDDPIFAEDVVEYFGQSIFAVVATTLDAARRAASLARIDYEPLPAITDIEDALARESFLAPSVELCRGTPDAQIATSTHRLQGEMYIGGQDHLYLEGQVAIATPADDGAMDVQCSTQNPAEVQRLIANTLGLNANQVVVVCRRLGGGFGGKETQPALFACISAIAAMRTGRPVKLRVDRASDMMMTGKRHDFLVRYDVGFDDDGNINGLTLVLASRCGRSEDLSIAVNTRAILHADNCYFFEHLKLVSHRAKTHTVSNTAFRGFGAPQAILAIEQVIDDIARHRSLDPLLIRRRHFYGGNGRNTTHYGMTVDDNVIERLVAELVQSSAYDQRRAELQRFNRENPVLKRGMALTPVKFGISFTQTHLNQAGALLNLYDDGSVMLNHGGVEMGQGLHAKVASVVATELGISIDRIQCTATDTSKVPNTSPTAASASSDLNGKAAQQAAQRLRARLARYASERFGVPAQSIEFDNGRVMIGNEQLEFCDLVADAHKARISLSATGFYRTPEINFDPENHRGRPFFYFVYGAAVSQVVLDTLTGEHRLERVNILQDAGRPLNPAIDRGQVEGGFLQGVGWLTMEELYWDEDAKLTTLGPGTYKIPTSHDWPAEFEIDFVDWCTNPADTIYGSKGVGEPPLCLAASVFLAIKDAIASTTNASIPIKLDAPATPTNVMRALRSVEQAR